ncbi:hypothetical protein ACF0H5_018140 [Mactra antiquata]
MAIYETIVVSSLLLFGTIFFAASNALPVVKQDTIDGDSVALDSVKLELEALEERVKEANDHIYKLKQEITSTDTGYSHDEQNDEQNDDTTDSTVIVNGEVGFSAKLSTNVYGLPVQSVVKYDYVAFNAGNGYDPETGIFTVPKDGMYMFIFFVEALGSKTAEVVVVLYIEQIPSDVVTCSL